MFHVSLLDIAALNLWGSNMATSIRNDDNTGDGIPYLQTWMITVQKWNGMPMHQKWMITVESLVSIQVHPIIDVGLFE